jgi:holo-[acyl-carrier protein] synthase
LGALPSEGALGAPRAAARTLMIFGIGADVCDVRRIRAVLARRGEAFAERVLGAHEIAVFRARRAQHEERGVRYLATRFSAKEAFSKAIGLGMRTPMTWRGCEIVKRPSGKPEVRLHGALADWFAARGLSAHVTVTDEADYAASFVVVEQETAR